MKNTLKIIRAIMEQDEDRIYHKATPLEILENRFKKFGVSKTKEELNDIIEDGLKYFGADTFEQIEEILITKLEKIYYK